MGGGQAAHRGLKAGLVGPLRQAVDGVEHAEAGGQQASCLALGWRGTRGALSDGRGGAHAPGRWALHEAMQCMEERGAEGRGGGEGGGVLW